MVGLGQKSVGRVHFNSLESDGIAKNTPSPCGRGAVSPKLLRVFKAVTNSIQFLCISFPIMIIFYKFRALDSTRHGGGDKLDGIGLGCGLGGEDQFLAPQVFVAASGDVALDGLAPFWRVNAEGGVLLLKWLDMGKDK